VPSNSELMLVKTSCQYLFGAAIRECSNIAESLVLSIGARSAAYQLRLSDAATHNQHQGISYNCVSFPNCARGVEDILIGSIDGLKDF
jgi:hypothetical protein